MHGKTAVAGVGESRYYKQGAATETEFQMACIAVKNAAADAGLPLDEIDGIVSYIDRNDPARLSAALGLKNVNFTGQGYGGGGNLVAAAMAIADSAVAEGYANYVVVLRALAQGQFFRFGQARVSSHVEGVRALEAPFGLATPAQRFALPATRFLHDHGISHDALFNISFASYTHAQRNHRAVRYGRPLTREDYDNSRWITYPYHLFDCCQENDGAAAVIVTTAERARALKQKPAYIKSGAVGIEFRGGTASFNEPIFPRMHYKLVGEKLWERAGVGPKDVDVAQFYENFTGVTLMAMSEIGFAPPDGIEEFVSKGNLLWPNGGLPINTSGGNLAEAYIHGFEIINEAVRQVRGESTAQVKDVELSLAVSGPGLEPGVPGSAMLFSKEPG